MKLAFRTAAWAALLGFLAPATAGAETIPVIGLWTPAARASTRTLLRM